MSNANVNPAHLRNGKQISVANSRNIEGAIIEAGLDWEVGLEPKYGRSPEGEYFKLSGEYNTRIIRLDTQKDLGSVSPEGQYNVLQNRRAFDFFQRFLDQGKAELWTAGSIRGGKGIYITAKINSESEIVTGDVVSQYVVLSNWHNAKRGVTANYLPYRRKCFNTLAWTSYQDGSIHNLNQLTATSSYGVGIAHNNKLGQILSAAEEKIEMAQEAFDYAVNQYRQMAGVPITQPEELKEYFVEVFSLETKELKDESTKEAKLLQQLMQNYSSGIGLGGQETQNYWGAYNSVTQFLEHQSGRNVSSQVQKSLFDRQTAQLRQRAHTIAVKVSL